MPLVVAPNAPHQKKIPDKRRGEKGPRASISVPAPEPRQHLLHLLIGNQSTPKVKEKKKRKRNRTTSSLGAPTPLSVLFI